MGNTGSGFCVRCGIALETKWIHFDAVKEWIQLVRDDGVRVRLCKPCFNSPVEVFKPTGYEDYLRNLKSIGRL